MRIELLDDLWVPSQRRLRLQQHIADLDLKQTLRDVGLPFALSGWDARLSCPEGHAGTNLDVALRLVGERKGRWHCWSPGCPQKGFLDRLVALLCHVEREEAERLLGFFDEETLVKTAQGVLDWNGLMASFPTQTPMISRESMRRGPSPPGASEATLTVPKPLFRDERLIKYLASPARGFADPERVIARHGLALGKWAKAGEKTIPGLRVFMPVRDHEGRYRGWAARSLDGRVPKVLYPTGFPSTSVLYGEDRLEELLAWEDGHLVLVEGAFDMIKLQDFQVPALATWGAKLTEEHFRRLLAGGANRLTVAYDGDEAGLLGMRLAWSVIAGRMPAQAVGFPPGQDAGNLKNKEEWERLPRVPLAKILD